MSIGREGGGAGSSEWQVADGAGDRGQAWRGLARPGLDRERILLSVTGIWNYDRTTEDARREQDCKITLDEAR
jgi:hypothetical protein